jgi:phospholipase/carboxylesterase
VSNPHLAEPVFFAGRAPEHASAVTVLVHGRNETPQKMLALAEALALPEMAFIAVSAAAKSWYPKGFMAPLAENQPQLDDALERLERLVEGLQRPLRQIALVGFSQGACLSSEFVSRRGGRWGALIALTGGLIGPPEQTTWPGPPLDGTPVLLGINVPDDWVPVGRVRQTADVLRARGGQVELIEYPGQAHTVSDDELARARVLLASLTPRAG